MDKITITGKCILFEHLGEELVLTDKKRGFPLIYNTVENAEITAFNRGLYNPKVKNIVVTYEIS